MGLGTSTRFLNLLKIFSRMKTEEKDVVKTTATAREAVAAPAAADSEKLAVLLDFNSYSQAKYDRFAAKVMRCCKGNPNGEPPKELTDRAQADLDAYDQAVITADADPSPANTEAKNEALQTTKNSLVMVADWVASNSGGKRAVAMSYGFKLAKVVRSKATLLEAPINVKWTYGMPGTVVFSCKSLGDRVEYRVYTSADGITWTMNSTSRKSFKIIAEKLERGKEYFFKIAGVNAAGEGLPWFSPGIIAAV